MPAEETKELEADEEWEEDDESSIKTDRRYQTPLKMFRTANYTKMVEAMWVVIVSQIRRKYLVVH